MLIFSHSKQYSYPKVYEDQINKGQVTLSNPVIIGGYSFPPVCDFPRKMIFCVYIRNFIS